MKPQRIILVRHGQSMGNVDKTTHETVPDHKIDITTTGVQQAIAAGRTIKEMLGDESVQFYVSPFKRTRQTLDGLLEGMGKMPEDHRIYESDDLREQEWGHLRSVQQTKLIEKERDLFGSYFFRIPNGESGADVCTRVAVFLNTLHRDFAKESCARNVVIVSHGLTIRLFCKRWFHWTVDYYESLRNPKNGEIFVMEMNHGNKCFVHSADGKYVLKTPFQIWEAPSTDQSVQTSII